MYYLLYILVLCFFFFFLHSISCIRIYSVILSGFFFFYFCALWLLYDPLQDNMQFYFKIKYFNLYFIFCLDAISLFFCLLTSFLLFALILFNNNNIYFFFKKYILLLFFFEIILFLIFTVFDIFIFYIGFESILIPMFIFIGIWGSRQRKIHASYLLFLYTLFGSLFMLIILLFIFSNIGTTNINLLYNIEFSILREKFIWFGIFIAFAIKIPMFPFHIWLPEAHVEAPTEGSVILAGILLKLGSYGFLRLLLPFLMQSTIYFIPFLLLLCILGIVYPSFVTLRQSDLKRIIAYSSIAHMNIALLGLFSLNIFGFIGGFIIFLTHGIVSGGLFFIIGMLYDRTKTRIVKYYNGLVYFMPILIASFFIFILANISLPGLASFIGEFIVLLSLFLFNIPAFLFSLIGIFLCTLYSLWLYNRISYGLFNYNYIIILKDITRIEFNIILPLLFLLLFLGIKPNIIIDDLLYFFYIIEQHLI